MFRDSNFHTAVLFLVIAAVIGLMILVIVVDAPLPENDVITEVTPEVTPAG